ncbi:MAG: chemotaxis protein CheB, partial [Candidatus Heimdallarchaeota archaeon]
MTIKVVVVDRRTEDRNVILKALKSDGGFNVVSTGNSGKDAISLTKRLNPKLLIITTSITDMPLLTVVKRIMQQSPVPILVIDSGDKGIKDKPSIVQYGMVDWLQGKRSRSLLSVSEAGIVTRSYILAKLNVSKFEKQLHHIQDTNQGISQIAAHSLYERRARIEKIIGTTDNKEEPDKLTQMDHRDRSYSGTGRLNRIIVIGTSTGGPKLLSEIVPKLPPNLPPILLVQHMPEGFTLKFSERLNRTARLTVKEARDGEIVSSGIVYVAPGGYHLRIVPNPKGYPIISLMDSQPVNFVKPSVDVTLYSAVDIYKSGVISVILTGMGSDGKSGSVFVKKMGGVVLALHESDTDIYGMNRSVIESGIVDEILRKNELVGGIVRALEGRLRG